MGGQVAAGSATITGQGSKTVEVDQSSSRAILTWTSFDTTPGQSVSFVQPSASSITLNRVVGGGATSFFGSLTANGQVFLINPNGVLFGSSAEVNVAGLLVTSADLQSQSFLSESGSLRFGTAGSPDASVVNQGRITIADAGMAAFVAPQVVNSGVILARYGQIALGAGQTFTLDLNGDGLISFAPGDGGTAARTGPGVAAGGVIAAASGQVLLTAASARQVVNQSVDVTGLVSAASATATASGVHLGGAAPGGSVTLSGPGNVTLEKTARLDVSSTASTGGSVTVTGANVEVAGALIDADGAAGGGVVLIGGGARGQGSLAHAETTSVEAGSTITADAATAGSGGHVVLWSDQATYFGGIISANGPSGGLVETSSAGQLDVPGQASAKALSASGTPGQWLLDPYDITLSSNTAANINTSGATWVATAETGNVNVSTIDTALTNGTSVTIATTAGSTGGGTISVNASIASGYSGTGSTPTLTLNATNALTFASGVSVTATGNSPLNLQFTSASGAISGTNNTFATNGGNLVMTATGSPNPTSTAGTYQVDYNNVYYGGGITFNGLSINVGAGAATLTGGLAAEASNATPADVSYGVMLTNAVALTASGAGSITVNGTGSWGAILGLPTIALTSNGAVAINGTASNKTANRGGLLIGTDLGVSQPTLTDQTGSLTLTGTVGGSNNGYGLRLGWQGVSNLVNSGSGTLTLDAVSGTSIAQSNADSALTDLGSAAINFATGSGGITVQATNYNTATTSNAVSLSGGGSVTDTGGGPIQVIGVRGAANANGSVVLGGSVNASSNGATALTITADTNLDLLGGFTASSSSGPLSVAVTSNYGEILGTNTTFKTQGGSLSITATDPATPTTTNALNNSNGRSAAVALVGGLTINVGTGTAAITGLQANENASESTGSYLWADGVWISGTTSLTSTGSGSITVSGTGAWGVLTGWYTGGLALTSNGTNTIVGTGSGLLAGEGGLWIGNGSVTSASGVLTLNGYGGDSVSSLNSTAIISSGALSFVNNGSATLNFNGYTQGSANTYSATWLPSTTITNNSTGNINIYGTRIDTACCGNEIGTQSSTISNTSSGSIIYTAYDNHATLGGDGIYSASSTITNSGSGSIIYNPTDSVTTGNTTGCCGWMTDISNSTITNSGSGNITAIISGDRHGLLVGGTYTNSGTGLFTLSGATTYWNCCTQGVQVNNLTTNGNFTISGTSAYGDGIVTYNTLTNSSGNLTLNGRGYQIGLLIGGGYDTAAYNNNSNGGSFTLNGVNTSAGGQQGGVWMAGPEDILNTSGAVTINGTSPGASYAGVVFDRPAAITASNGTLTVNGYSTSGAGLLFNTNYTWPTANDGNYVSGALNGTQGFLTTSGSIVLNGTSSAGYGVQTNSTTYLTNTGALAINGTSTSAAGVALGWGGGTQSFTNQNGGTVTVAGVSASSYGLFFNGNQNFLFAGSISLSGQSATSSGVYIPYANSAYDYTLTGASLTLSGSVTGTGGYAIDTKGANPVFIGDAASSLTLEGATLNLASSTFEGFQALAFAPLSPASAFSILGTKVNIAPASGVSSSPSVTFGSAAETGSTTLSAINDTAPGSLSILGGSGALTVAAVTGTQLSSLLVSNAPAGSSASAALELLGTISAPTASVTISSNGAVSGGQSLTVGGLAVTSGGAVSLSGALIAPTVSVSASGAITLNNTGDQFSQVAAATTSGAIDIVDGNGGSASSLTVANLNGINGIQDSDASARGLISLVSSGPIDLTAPVSAASVGAGVASPAVLISAGNGRSAGDASTAYDLSITMAEPASAVQVGAGGSALLYTGSLAGSVNLGTVGTPGEFRYDSTPAAANYTAALGPGIDVIYRAQPVLTAVWDLPGVSANASGVLSGVYTGSAFTPTLAVSSTSTLYNGDTVALQGSISGQTALNVGSYTFSAGSITTNLGYKVLPLAPLSFSITPAPLAVNVSGVSAENKVYDGTDTADFLVTSAPTASFLGTDGQHLALTYAGGAPGPTGVFASANASVSPQTVSLNNLVLTASAGYSVLLSDYSLQVPTFQAVISRATLQIAGVSADSKTYDGTTAAALSLSAPTVTGWVGNDASQVSVNFSDLQGVFTQKDVGTWSVGVSANGQTGFLTGSASILNNYTLVFPTNLTATISPLTLTYVGGISTTSNGNLTPGKVYDGGVNAALIGAPTLSGLIGTDKTTVKVDSAEMSGQYNSPNVDTASAITVTGIGLSGVDSQDYLVPQIQLAATITPAPVGVSGLTAANKIYDGTTAIAVNGAPILTSVLTQDAASVAVVGPELGTAASKDVGAGISVTVATGTDGLHLVGPAADDYALAIQNLSATITPKTVTLAVNDQSTSSPDGLYVRPKVYDGTTSASLAGPAVIEGLIPTDSNSISLVSGGVLAAYRSPNAGASLVDIAAGSYSLAGSASADYSLVLPVLSGTIAPAPLTVSGLAAVPRLYDGTSVVAVDGLPVLTGVVGKDAVSVNATGLSGLLSSPNAGQQTAVVQGLALSGGAASNYVLAADVLSVLISQAPLQVTGLSLLGGSKVYDGTTLAVLTGTPRLQGVVLTDLGQVALAGTPTGSFQDPNVGADKPIAVSGLSLTGAEAANYTLNQAQVSASITPATLTYAATPESKFLGQPNPALTGAVTGLVDGQTLASATTGSLRFTTAATLNSPVGIYAVTGGGLSAVDGDYVFVQAPGNASALAITAPYTPSTIGLVTTLDTGLADSNPASSATILIEALAPAPAPDPEASALVSASPATPAKTTVQPPAAPQGPKPLLCVLIPGASLGCGQDAADTFQNPETKKTGG